MALDTHSRNVGPEKHGLFPCDHVFLYSSRIRTDKAFEMLRLGEFDTDSQDQWVLLLWHTFELIYSRELDAGICFQPQIYENTLRVTPTTLFFQPVSLTEMCQIVIDRQSPNDCSKSCGQDLNGHAISSIVQCLLLRQQTGRTKQFCGSFKGRMRAKMNPLHLRTVTQAAYWPVTSQQWKFWKEALFWVYQHIWGIDYRASENAGHYSSIPLTYRLRLDWVKAQYREAKKKERKAEVQMCK